MGDDSPNLEKIFWRPRKMIIDTSLDAWNNVKSTLKKRQKEIYETILKYPDHTAAELGAILHKPVNAISGRFSELGPGTDKHPGINVIMRAEKRICAKTKGLSWTWRKV